MAELRDRLEELERRLERAEKALRNGPPWALRGCSTLVTFEDIMVDFNREEWASLDDEQQDLYRTVMEDNYDTLVSLYCALSKPDLVAQMERREEPCVLAKPCWEEADMSSVDMTPTDGSPMDGSLAGGSLGDMSPMDMTPSSRTLVGGSLSDLTSEDLTLADRTLVDKSPVDVTSVDTSLSDMTPENGSPADVTPADPSLSDVTPADVSPVDISLPDMTPAGVTPADTSLSDVTPEGMTPVDTSLSDMTPENGSPANVTPTDITLADRSLADSSSSQEQKLEHSSNDGLLEETNQSVSENREKPEESQSLAVTISCNTLHIPQEAAAVPMDLSQLIQSPSCPRSVCPYEAVNPNQSLSPPPTAADAEVVIPMEVLPEEVAKKPTEPETLLEAMGRVTDMKESGNGQALAASVPEEPGKEVLTDVCHTPAQEAPAVEGSCVGRTAVCQRNSMREKCYSCPICSKNFLLKINLIIHQRSHNSCLPYICAHCKRSFMSKKKIQRHLQARDIKGFCPVLEAEDCTSRAACPASQLLTPNCGTAVWEKPSPNRFPLSPGKMMYTCNECMENFSSQSFLLLHQRRHASRHVILCPCCNRTFTWAKDFVRHHWTHTDERPYQCGVCQKTFKRRYHLNVHQRIHMRQERPYPCSEQQAVPAAPV